MRTGLTNWREGLKATLHIKKCDTHKTNQRTNERNLATIILDIFSRLNLFPLNIIVLTTHIPTVSQDLRSLQLSLDTEVTATW